MEISGDIDYLVVDNSIKKGSHETNLRHQVIPQFNKYDGEENNTISEYLQNNISNKLLEDYSDSTHIQNDEADNLNFNVSNRKYLFPSFSKKSYMIPKVVCTSLSMKNRRFEVSVNAYDFGLSETISYKTKFPQSLNYERLCPSTPPYIAPLLISLLQEMERHVPPISKLTSGSSQQTLESADSLFDTMLTVHINQTIPKHIAQIFYLNVTVKVLTNTLHVFFQRLTHPLFLATTEFCNVITSNKYDIKLIQFGCHKCDSENEVIQSLTRCLAISSNYQVANLAYFIEICQRWIQLQIKFELDRKPMGSADVIYEDALANLAMVFGKTIVGIPKTFVAYKIMRNSLPLVDDIRRLIVYFLLGIPPFEFWHLWSINSLCFEDKEKKCKCKRGAFLSIPSKTISLEAIPNV